ncbi:inositol monophosphatase family protein [Amycolatopsis sp. PS_44_ISF1]|uniref:inositol monophosphatase family protein n=1 Tax=Amycolatopsis sp. PS_44_ISF1 TaxID=2974917 RepID=UPI0028DF8C6D|nr:inositol monophosphatase family protein [Amycolatopsis sp. PS_44_ISF1]MDT8913389.1 3'(2'),5'-bisphosphate nucleotidase CysQ [Amycolatopsis sp. PS_44_ISF1]
MTLLTAVTEAARKAGARLLTVHSPSARPSDRADLFAAVSRNDAVALDGLRAELAVARPGAGWLEDEQETTELPPGEWWAVDAVEGNVNHVHGLAEWAVTVTLLRDGVPVLAVVHQPIGDHTYTAVAGEGAWLDGTRLRVSAKRDLGAAIVTTGQAESGQTATYRRIGDSVTAMLGRALLVRVSVPSTFPLLLLANGQNDGFWQYEPVLSGLAAGLLLATEAGATATRIDGSPWRPGSPDVLITVPALHEAAVAALSSVG